MAVTPKQVYTGLVNAGASTIQAIGIMANGLAESGLNPEAIGDQGTSFGTWQQHGAGYAGLVTGNPDADLAAQIKVVAQNGGFAAASGSNAGEAAGNFAANYERCTTCQPGGTSYDQRVANAATVAGWVSSGKWPSSAGSAATPGASGALAASNDPSCAWGFSGSLVVTQVNICVIKKATLRHVVGGGLMVAGGTVGLFGVVLLAAFAFRASGAARAAGQIAGTVSPAGRVYKRQAARHQATVTRSERATRAETARGSREARRAAGTPRNQARAARGQAPRRPPPPPRPRPPRE